MIEVLHVSEKWRESYLGWYNKDYISFALLDPEDSIAEDPNWRCQVGGTNDFVFALAS